MRENSNNFSGVFKVYIQRRTTIFLQVILAIVYLVIIIFGIWAIRIDFYDLDNNLETHFPEIFLIVLMTIVLPSIMLIIACREILIKPGVYLEGIKISNQGVETGAIKLDVDLSELKEEIEIEKYKKATAGEWKQHKKVDKDNMNIEIVFRVDEKLTKFIIFERVIFLCGNKVKKQFISKNFNENILRDIVVYHNGSLQLIEDGNGMDFMHFFRLLETLESIAIVDGSSHYSYRTLKLDLKPIAHDNPLATGVLGGLNSCQRNDYCRGKVLLENLFDTSDLNVLKKFMVEKGWKLLIES